MPAHRYVVDDGSSTVAPSEARRAVATALRERGAVEDARFDAAVLVTSELVTNAILHAGPVIDLNIVALPRGLLRLEVKDTGPVGSVRRSRTPGPEGGWGLNVVHRLALDWGTVPARWGPGKTVWAELDVSFDDRSARDDAEDRTRVGIG